MTVITEQTAYSQLGFLRLMIDNIDSAILSILAHRAQVVSYIIGYKTAQHLEASRSQMRQASVAALLDISTELDLRQAFIEKILECLFNESKTFLNKSEDHAHAYCSIMQDNMLVEFNRTLKNLDVSLFSLLAERMHLVKQVGEYKKRYHIQPLARSRWEQVLASKMEQAKSLHINVDAIRHFYNLIHEEALFLEARIIGG